MKIAGQDLSISSSGIIVETSKHRFDTTERGEYGLNSLCDGLMYFFSHVEPYMIKMRDLIYENKAPKDIMKMKL